MSISARKLTNIVSTLESTFTRFPLPITFAFGATILALLLIYDIHISHKRDTVKLFLTLLYCSFSLASLKLLVENHSWSLRTHFIVALVLVFVIVLFTWDIIASSKVTLVFFSLSVLLSLLVAPYINNSKKSSSASFWYFNYQTGVAVFFAGLAAIVLASGLSIILVSIGFLFEIKVASEFYPLIWVLSSGVLFTLYFLSNIATEFDFDDEACDFPKGIRFITNYLLVPLMWTYMAILYAYFFKIIFQWQLPHGNLGWVITAFGTVGIITKLLAYPIRNSGTKLLQLYDKYYYYALMVPIILLGLAIGIRINEYGITETRYAVVLLGLWFAIVAIVTVIKKEQFHIKYVPMTLALLAFFASFGPWGAFELSLNSQVQRFESVLIKHGLFIDGQAVKGSADISFEDRQSLSSMAMYLTGHKKRRKRIMPWFETLIKQSDANSEITAYRSYGAREIIELMGVKYTGSWYRKNSEKNFNYSRTANNSDCLMFDVRDYDFFGTGTVYLYSQNHKPKKYTIKHKNSNTNTLVTVTHKNGNLQVTIGDEIPLSFDLKKVVRSLMDKNSKVINASNVQYLTLTKNSVNTRTNTNIKLQIKSISGSIDEGKEKENKKVDVRTVSYVLMLKFNSN